MKLETIIKPRTTISWHMATHCTLTITMNMPQKLTQKLTHTIIQNSLIITNITDISKNQVKL
jgi:hypothetical protein